jgi:hypothetical protein
MFYYLALCFIFLLKLKNCIVLLIKKSMRIILIFIISAYLIITNSWIHASDEWKHMRYMSLCNIDHIQIAPFQRIYTAGLSIPSTMSVSSMHRESPEEYYKYCKDSMIKSDVDAYRCFIKEPSYSRDKKEELSKNIKYLYASHISEEIGINTEGNPAENSFSGRLIINVHSAGYPQQDGKISYGVMHTISLEEQAISRYGRKDFMPLEWWLESDDVIGIENADMTTLRLVASVVNKMKETFREAREYCTKYNLFQQ